MARQFRVSPVVPILAVSAVTLLAAAACSSGSSDTNNAGGSNAMGGSATAGSGGVGTPSGGANSSAGAGTSVAGAAAGGAPAVAGSGNGGSGTAGASAGTSSTAGQSGGSSVAGGAGAGAGAGGAGGALNCTGRALSLSSNGTASDADTAQAEVVIDLMDVGPIGNAKRTVEFWAFIKSTDWVGEKNEVYYYGKQGNAGTFGLDFGTNPVTGTSNHATLNPFTGGGLFTVDGSNDLGITSTSDQWVHIAMTWDGTAVRTYVNSKLGITANASGSTTMLATNKGPLIMGCNPENNNCFNGLFDELRVWNIARTDLQIADSYKKPLVGNETGLIGYWKFNDAVGSTTAADSLLGGTPHNGTLKAAATAQMPTFVTPPTPLPLLCP